MGKKGGTIKGMNRCNLYIVTHGSFRNEDKGGIIGEQGNKCFTCFCVFKGCCDNARVCVEFICGLHNVEVVFPSVGEVHPEDAG